MIELLTVESLGDKERQLLCQAAEEALDSSTVDLYYASMADGRLGVWSLWDKGIIGLSFTNKVVWVEFLMGEDIAPHAQELLEWLKAQAKGRRVEALPSRKGMIRRLESMGFKPVSTLMRLEG